MTAAKRQKISHGVQNGNSDCLSRLPNHVVSRILTHLPTGDAFATRRLCRGWFLAWASDPILDFSDQADQLQDDFVAFGDRTLSHLRHGALVRKLKLQCRMFGLPALDRFESWLALVNERNVRELDIDAVTIEIPYTLPQAVLGSASLTTLKLANLHLKVLKNPNDNKNSTLKSLKTLSLSHVKFDDESIRNLIESCRSLEHLEIRNCLGARRVRMRSRSLKVLDVRHYGTLSSPRVEIEEAEALEALTYYSGKVWGDGYGKLERLKSLCLQVMWAGPGAAALLEERIAELPSLEALRIGLWGVRGGGRRAIKICGAKLKHLEVDGASNNLDVVVEAPNLKSFAYDKRFVSVSGLNSPKLKMQD